MTVTSYNPERGQTDGTPCIGASGQDQCALAKQGKRIIAISQDLRSTFLAKQGKYYQYPAQVYVESDNPQIQGCYWIYDVMNKRLTDRIDLFFLERKNNTGGTAVISNKTELCNTK